MWNFNRTKRSSVYSFRGFRFRAPSFGTDSAFGSLWKWKKIGLITLCKMWLEKRVRKNLPLHHHHLHFEMMKLALPNPFCWLVVMEFWVLILVLQPPTLLRFLHHLVALHPFSLHWLFLDVNPNSIKKWALILVMQFYVNIVYYQVKRIVMIDGIGSTRFDRYLPY